MHLIIGQETVRTGVWRAGDGGAAQRSAGQLSLLADLQLHRVPLLSPSLLQPDTAGGGSSVEDCEEREVLRFECSNTGTVERVPLVELIAGPAGVSRRAG